MAFANRVSVPDETLAKHEQRAREYLARWPEGCTTYVWADDLLELIAEVRASRNRRADGGSPDGV